MPGTRTELYLIRHAETVRNTEPHLVGGRSNYTPLTEKGIGQAKHLGRVLREKGIFPLKVFVSPAVRTVATAELSLAEMGLDVEPLVHDAIQELSQGEWEGKPRAEAYTDEVMADIVRLGKDFKLPGGESMNEVGLRMHDWITETFAEPAGNDELERYFVYTHGGSIKNLASHILGLTHQQTFEMPIDNTTLNLFARESGAWQVEFLNRQPEEL